jgi:nickel-dependent lactate racemase
MSTTEVALPWGREQLGADLPENWHVAGVLKPSTRPAVADVDGETRASLAQPIGSARLSERVRAGMKVALVIDDGSRPTPVHKLFPAVLEELKSGGIREEDITVVPALGLHRPMSNDETAERLGRGGFKMAVHDADSPDLAHLGTTSRGVPVDINPVVAAADFVVSIGCIEPHIIASFGGGYKNIVPGVAGRATIAKNHTLNCRPDTFNMVGQPIERNPMRLDLEEAAKMLKPPVFIINAVLNSTLEPVAVVSGDPIEAHRSGSRISAEIYGTAIPGQADVVIAGSYPMDQDLRQGVKALANTIRAVRPGGVMITAIRAEEGVGVFGLADQKLPVGRGTLKRLAPVILPLVPRIKIQGLGEEDRFFLYFALQAMHQSDLLIYGPTIPAETQANLPFASFAPTLQDAVAQAQHKFPRHAEVLIFPYGGMTYPVLPA